MNATITLAEARGVLRDTMHATLDCCTPDRDPRIEKCYCGACIILDDVGNGELWRAVTDREAAVFIATGLVRDAS